MPRFDLIGLVVSDMERSAAFYRQLGVTFPEPLDPEGHGHAEATLAGGLRFALDSIATIRSFDPDWQPPTEGHQMGLAFLCDSPTEVDSTFERLVSGGAAPHKQPWDAFWGQRYAQVKDPDGNVVDLFSWIGDAPASD